MCNQVNDCEQGTLFKSPAIIPASPSIVSFPINNKALLHRYERRIMWQRIQEPVFLGGHYSALELEVSQKKMKEKTPCKCKISRNAMRQRQKVSTMQIMHKNNPTTTISKSLTRRGLSSS
jgi:hypothetical protein